MMTHYYDVQQSSPVKEEHLPVTVRGRSYSFTVASGLFSKRRLDIATRLLIESADLSACSSALDFGCGWGAVAVVLKDCFPDVDMVATDVNSRAISYTKKNASNNNVSIAVKRSDLLENIPETFDAILTNPPYVAGRKVCFSFIEQAFDHLNTGGIFYLVARHSKGGKMLSKKMEEVFGDVSDNDRQGGFRVYKAIKR